MKTDPAKEVLVEPPGASAERAPASDIPVRRSKGRRWLRLGAETLHDVASIGFGGALASCLVVDMTANRAYMDAGWAWLKALLGPSVLEATLPVTGSGQHQAGFAAAAADPGVIDAMPRSERDTLWLLIAVSAANVVLAVWRPRLTVKVR